MNAILRLSLVLSAAAVPAARLPAQQVPALETGDRLVRSQMIEGQMVMRDALNNRLLLDNRGIQIHEGTTPGALLPQIIMQEQMTGFDLVFLYHNTAAAKRPLGDIHLGVFPLGQHITVQDFRSASQSKTWDNQRDSAAGLYYPEDLYSPVAVLRNDEYAIGISLQYPVLAYEHDACVSLLIPRGHLAHGEGGMGWSVHFALAGSPHGSPMQHPGLLEPGEHRKYVVSVRVSRQPEQWVRTLKPYRDYFRWGYGGVRYQRNPNPVVGINIADGANITPTNLCGWGTTQRPDVYGWVPWVQYMKVNLTGWRRFMIWTPSGLYDQRRELNYPFQFTTHWLSDPQTATATHPINGLPAIHAAGSELGLWWGRALQYADRWNPYEMPPLDPRNPQHVAAAMAEVDLAFQAGTRVIGLDTFVHDQMPIWDQIIWLAAMKERAPGMKFVIEPSACDIMHRLAASYVHGGTTDPHPATIEDLYPIKTPDYFADFLLPGHETWIALVWHNWQQHFQQTPTEQRIRQDIKKYAQMGYVPLVFTKTAASQEFRAAESWTHTVPPELQVPPGAPAGVLSIPGVTGNGPAPLPPSGGGGVTHHGTPMNQFMAARLFSRAQLRAAIRSVMGLP